jgi:hypothetical protein
MSAGFIQPGAPRNSPIYFGKIRAVPLVGLGTIGMQEKIYAVVFAARGTVRIANLVFLGYYKPNERKSVYGFGSHRH